MEAEPGVRVGLAVVLGGRAEVDDAKVRGVGVALLLASATDGLGLTAEVGDLTDDPESRDVTEERVGPVAAGFATVFAAGVVVAGFAPGASDALRAGAAGVAVVEGRGGGGIEVLLLAVVDELVVLRIAVAAAAGTFEVVPGAVAFVADEVGAALVPAAAELTVCIHETISFPYQHLLQ